MQTPARLVAAAVLPVSVLAMSACSGSGEDKAVDPAKEPPAGAAECTADDITVEGDFGSAPEITLPDDCTPPTSLLT